jgi:hypothetical protein
MRDPLSVFSTKGSKMQAGLLSDGDRNPACSDHRRPLHGARRRRVGNDYAPAYFARIRVDAIESRNAVSSAGDDEEAVVRDCERRSKTKPIA